MTIVDLAGRETEPGVIELLAEAQIHRDPADARERAPAIAHEYATRPELRLWGYTIEAGVAGVMGVEVLAERAAIIRDLAVREDQRRRGVGRGLLDFARANAGVDSLEGDTLAGSVPFYRRCGFTIREDGEMPNGDIRYRFLWRR